MARKNLILLVVFSLLGLSFSYLRAEDESSEKSIESTYSPDSLKKRKGGHGAAPVVGYEPTFKFVFGGAYFYEGEELSLGTDFNLNFKQVYQLHFNVAHRFADDWEYSLRSGVTKGFDPYYGEGGETDPLAFTKLWGIKSGNRFQLIRNVNPIMAVGIFGEARYRNETAELDKPFARKFPDETTGALGVTLQVDTRKNKQNPREGFVFVTNFLYSPHALTTLPNTRDFAQAEGSFIVYKEILKEVLPEVIAAYMLRGGYSAGEPSYLYRYRLGGSDELPGYLQNRFRGKQYYLQQTELRFPIWKMIGGAGLMGFGDTTDSRFTNPKLAYGVGLRIGLPPDWTSKLRLDFAFGKDEQGIFADFGQSF